MKKKKRRKNRLFLTILWLFFVAVLFATSTYAWFTTNRVVYINSLNVNVRAEGGIQISADGKNWKTILAIQDLIEARDKDYPTSVNQIPYRLEPVSTGKIIDTSNGFLNMYHGYVEPNSKGEYILESTRSIETHSGANGEGKFVAFDIFLKTNTKTDLYLTTDSGAVYEGNNSVGIENAVRVAFLIEGNALEGTTLNNIQRLKNATYDTTYIWEPNYDVHTEQAVISALEIYKINITTLMEDKIIYDGIIDEFNRNSNITVNKANSVNYPLLFKKIDVDYATKKNFNKNEKIFSIETGITKVRVYMWIEGQDIDCEDNASVGNFTFTLQMTSNKG